MSCFFRRDADIKPAPGTIIAEFSNGQDAKTFAEFKRETDKGDFVVTPGINHIFAVRIGGYESPGFKLIPLTPKGAEGAAYVDAMLRRALPHGDGEL